MDAVGEHDAAVIARAFESAKMSTQDVDPSKFARLDGVANPLRRRIEAEDVADLQNALFYIGQLGELLGFVRREGQRFLNEDILARLQEFPAERKMRLCRRDDDRSIDQPGEVFVVGGKADVGDTQFPGGFETFAIQFADIKLDGQRVEDAQVVGAPAPDAKQ